MYNRLKRLLMTLMFLVIAVGGIFFVFTNQSEMFNGYTDIILVEKATVNFKEQLEQIARDTNSVFAKRIVDIKSHTTGQSINTYVPIGADTLPSQLPAQTDQAKIDRSSDSTVYVVVKSDKSVEELAVQLQAKQNTVRVIRTNYKIVLLILLFLAPQSLMVVFVLLTAFTSLILAEYIAQIKAIGIRRISGESKHSIAMKQTYHDSIFLLGLVAITVLGTIGGLFSLNVFSVQALWVILTPMCIVFVLLLGLNVLLSHIFYYILQKQPIILSIKGKAPMKMISVIVLCTQLLTLFSVMYSVYGMHRVTEDITLLQRGQQAWEKHADVYQLTALEDDIVSVEEKKAFYAAIEKVTDLIYVETTLDRKAQLNSPLKDSYLPTADYVSNVIHVNATFIAYSPIKLSESVRTQIKQLKEHDKMILIPKTQAHQYDLLKEIWKKFAKKALLPDNVPFEDPNPEAVYYTGLYEATSDIFVYPVFSSAGQLYSNEAFVTNPIIVVEKQSLWIPSYVRVADANKVTQLIKEKNVSNAFGALTNGVYAINNRLQAKYNDKLMLIVATIISVFSAVLLFILLNVVYFYQNRKNHFIERLAGKSLLSIHKVYIAFSVVFCVLAAFGAFLLNLTWSVVITPLFYMVGVFIIFAVQLYREKRANVLYLKGE